MSKYFYIIFIFTIFIFNGVSMSKYDDIHFYIQNKRFPRKKKVRIKEEILLQSSLIDDITFDRYRKFDTVQNYLIIDGINYKSNSTDEVTFSLFQFPELQLLHKESLIKGRFISPLGKFFIHNNRLFFDYSKNIPGWITYYNLSDFKQEKAFKPGGAFRIFDSISENEILCYDYERGIYVLDNNYNIVKEFRIEDIRRECEDSGQIFIVYKEEKEVFFVLDHTVALLDLESGKILTKVSSNKKVGYSSFFKVNGKLYFKMLINKDNLPSNVYRYDKTNKKFEEMEDDIRFLLFDKSFNTSFDDLTFLGPASSGNEFALVKGDFDEIIYFSSKKIKKFAQIIGVIPYKNKYFMATGDGLFEFKIEDLYKLLEEHGRFEKGKDKIVRKTIILK